MGTLSARKQLDTFIARYTRAVAALACAALANLRAKVPGAVELVYDNYNALAIGFGPMERASDVILSPGQVSSICGNGSISQKVPPVPSPAESWSSGPPVQSRSEFRDSRHYAMIVVCDESPFLRPG
jgi:hypothetical protein